MVDQYIESLQLASRDLSDWVARTEVTSENLMGLIEKWSAAPTPGNCCVFISAWGEGPEFLREIAALELPTGLYVVIISPVYISVRIEQLRVIGAKASTDREFRGRVGGHMARFLRMQPPESAFSGAKPKFSFPVVKGGQHDQWLPILGENQQVSLDMLGHRLDLLSMLREDSSSLLVIEQSAVGRDGDRKPPFFQRWTWAEDFVGGSVIVLNDPLLYQSDSLKAGWWFGTRDHDLVHACVETVRRATSKLGLSDRDVVFYGGSAGGFSALHMAAAMPGAKAVADIPQIDMRTYHARVAADSAAKAAFGVHGIGDVPEHLLHRIDVIERFKHEKHVPTFLLLQNLRDSTHVVSQYADFVRRLSELNRVESWARAPYEVRAYSAWNLNKGGHFPLSRTDSMAEVNSFVERMRPVRPGA